MYVSHEDEDADVDGDGEGSAAAEENETSPPLKEKKNTVAKRGRGRLAGSKKGPPETKTTMPKKKAEQPVRTTRQSRSAKP